LPPGTVSAPQRPYKFTINAFANLGDVDDWESIANGTARVFLIGYVRYTDIFSTHYITGFCAVFDRVGRRFVLRGSEKYNYTRIEEENAGLSEC
jgi:hypothetical protein